MAFPKRLRLDIIFIDKDIAPMHSQLPQIGNTRLHQAFANARAAMPPGNRKMIETAPPAIMAAEDRANDFPALIPRDKAQPRISPQERLDSILAIGFAQTHPFRLAPERDDLFKVRDRHRLIGNTLCHNLP